MIFDIMKFNRASKGIQNEIIGEKKSSPSRTAKSIQNAAVMIDANNTYFQLENTVFRLLFVSIIVSPFLLLLIFFTLFPTIEALLFYFSFESDL